MNRSLLAFAALVSLVACSSDPETPTQGSTGTNSNGRSTAGGKSDDGSTWCHANIKLTGDVEVALDYLVAEEDAGNQGATHARPLWVNVRGPKVTEHSDAQAVVLERLWDAECGAYCRDNYTTEGTSQTIDLTFENGRLTGELAPVRLHSYDMSGPRSTDYLAELAVVIDGTWYKAETGANARHVWDSSKQFCEHGYTF